jgi:urease accessory protein
MQQREFTSPIIAAFGAHQLERCGATSLMVSGFGSGGELQPAGALPRVESLHLSTLDATRSPFSSDSYQIAGRLLGRLDFRWSGSVNDAITVLDQYMPALDRHKLDRQHVDLFLPLTAEQRTVLRGRRSTACGREVLLQLPRHGPLEPGDQLFNADASVRVEVKAALEDLLQVQAPTSLDLLAAAYHLGNRHVALELHDQELLLLDDSVLAAMLKRRGLVVTPCRRAFLPEGGAYAGHSHRHSSP